MKQIQRFIILAGITVLLLPLHGFAQKKWSLVECIDYALKNNLQVKQQRLALQLQEYVLLQSKANLLPMVNANVSHGYNYGRTVDRFTNTFASQEVQFDNFYLSGQFTLFNGFALLNTLSRNRYNLAAGKYDVEKLQNDISLNIASAYLNILFNIELLSTAQEQLDITRQQVERTKKFVDVGNLAKGNLYNIEAQAAAEELQVVIARNQLDFSYLILAQLLDLKSTDGFDIEQPQLTAPDNPKLQAGVADIFSMALQTQPQIKSAEMKMFSAEKDLKIARGYYSPVLSLSGSYGTGYSGGYPEQTGETNLGKVVIGQLLSDTSQQVISAEEYKVPIYSNKSFADQINDNVNKSIGLYLSIPIFNGLQARANVSKAKIGIENAALNYEIAKNQLNQDIQRAHADALAAVNKFNASKKSVEAMEEAYHYMEQKYAVGLVNSVEYNEAKKNLTKAQSELLQAKYEYVFKKTVLDFYMGKPIIIN